MSVCVPDAMAVHPPTWAGVGWANADSNQMRVAGENDSRTVRVGDTGLSFEREVTPSL